jgi:two-component system response regulator HydG
MDGSAEEGEVANILVIDDNDTVREGVAEVTRQMGHQVWTASGGSAGLVLWGRHDIDFTITDLKMDEVTGLDVLRGIRRKDPDALVLREANVQLLAEADGRYNFEEIVGQSEPMARIFQTVRKVARTDSTVYVYGESGTGKELVARAIHKLSPRSGGPFVKVNCSSLVETLLESELFGHEKGSFTGAHKRKIGRFELGHRGTVFLDEIGDISPSIQLKLLRVLQEREFERVGGEETIKVDVRVVTATNKDLRQLVDAGEFREDLFYRLHIIPLTLPPLRDRRSDIPLLVQHFVEKLAERTRSEVQGVSAEALKVLKSYAFPGNVRELENVIEQSLVFAEGNEIQVDDLPAHILGGPRGNLLVLPEGERTLPEILEELERQLIVRAFRKARGIKTETARSLGIKTSALYYKLEKYGVDESILD